MKQALQGKSRTKSKRKRPAGSLPRRVSKLLDFPEPPPAMDVSDPKWPDAFTAWCQRKAEWFGMDAIEMLGRALGCKKEADQWRNSQTEQRRKERDRLDHMANVPQSNMSVKSSRCRPKRERKETTNTSTI